MDHPPGSQTTIAHTRKLAAEMSSESDIIAARDTTTRVEKFVGEIVSKGSRADTGTPKGARTDKVLDAYYIAALDAISRADKIATEIFASSAAKNL